MDKVNYLELITSLTSSITTIAACVAAFLSLKVSRESRDITKQIALANHHLSIATELSFALKELKKSLGNLANISSFLLSKWAREIEKKEIKNTAGDNPRPIRHVLNDTAEMLANHSQKASKDKGYIHSVLFSIVVNGGPDISQKEYQSLLSTADGYYGSFEDKFGQASSKHNISESKAFRWSFSQLTKRMKKEDWKQIWQESLADEGYLNRFKKEVLSTSPKIEEIRNKLTIEKSRINLSTLPLSSDKKLSLTYNKLESILNNFDECVNFEYLEEDFFAYEDGYLEVILYSIGMMKLIENLYEEICIIKANRKEL